MKNKLHYLILITFTLFGCQSEEKDDTVISDESEVQIEHNYEEVSDYELFWESIFDVGETNYYVYFYSLTCSHCEELKNYIVEKGLERGDIYFVKGTSKDQITNDPKKAIGAEIPVDIWILGYPTMLKISNQKCTKNLAGINQIKAEIK